MKYKFAVVIPLYNKVDTVIRALDSVAVQSFTNYKVVVVDDGSADESGKLADSYKGIKNYKVIHLVKLVRRCFIDDIVRNYRHDLVDKNIILRDTYPTIFKIIGLYDSFLLTFGG